MTKMQLFLSLYIGVFKIKSYKTIAHKFVVFIALRNSTFLTRTHSFSAQLENDYNFGPYI